MKQVCVTGVSLVQMVDSREFGQHLAEAVSITKRKGYESGFAVYRDIGSDRDMFTAVAQGSASELQLDPESAAGRQVLRELSRESYEIFDLRLRPQRVGVPLTLSRSDLSILDIYPCYSDCETRPIAAIGAVAGNRQGHLLLLQRTYTGLLSDRRGEIEQQLWGRCQNAVMVGEPGALAEAIELPGYVQSGILNFGYHSSSKQFEVTNPEVIHKFGYSTRPNEARWTEAVRLAEDDN